MTAGHIDAALFKLGLIAVGKALDKAIRLSAFGCGFNFVHIRVLIAPAKVVFDRTRKQNILLQHHTDALAQVVQAVILDIDAIDKHFALICVV